MDGSLNEERKYWAERLLDTTRNLWIGPAFVKPVRDVLYRLPPEVLERLVMTNVAFMAPDRSCSGLVFEAPLDLECGQFVLYLSPELLGKPKDELDFTIAHELAHAWLGHGEALGDAASAEKDEREADRVAMSWGFQMPPSLDRY